MDKGRKTAAGEGVSTLNSFGMKNKKKRILGPGSPFRGKMKCKKTEALSQRGLEKGRGRRIKGSR